MVVLGPEHEATFVDAGWSRLDLQRSLKELSTTTAQALIEAGVVLEVGTHHNMVPDDQGQLQTVADLDDVFIVTAGGAGAGWSAVIPSLGAAEACPSRDAPSKTRS